MGIRIFSLEEANGVIPDLARRLEELRELVTRIVSCQDAIVVLELIGAPEDGSVEHAEYVRKKAVTEALVEEFDGRLREIHKLGCFVKDIKQGLVDFYSVRDGRLIFLCWKLGENSVGHWHELNTGFDGRRSIAELYE